MRGEVLGVERRWRWDDEIKLAIVSAVGIGGFVLDKELLPGLMLEPVVVDDVAYAAALECRPTDH